MRYLVVVSSVAAPVLFLVHLAVAYRVATASCEQPQEPTLLVVTLATLTLMALAGSFSLARYRQLANAEPSDERLLSLIGATTTPLFMLISLSLLLASLVVPPCG